MSYKLIVSIVPGNSGEFITDTANKAGAAGGTILLGRGTAANTILQLLGLGDTSKEITYNIVEDSIYKTVYDAIVESCHGKKAHFGVLFAIEVGSFVKAGKINESEAGEKDMSSENTYEMINVIVNKGYAEDAMAAARKAGAGGGTIINARGTAKEGDAQFFGMKIVPEKDMLMILAPKDKKDDILNAIKNVPCFAEAGSGIVFCQEARDFVLLGKN